MSAHAIWSEEKAKAIIGARADEKGAMLPILHDLQAHFGYVDDASIPLIASALNVSKAETIGVISFYHEFRRAPPPASVLKICRAESCQAAGCEEIVAHLEHRHGLSPDAHGGGALAIETVYCLGHCAASPAAMLDEEPLARLTPATIDELLAAKAKGGPWP